MFGKKKHKKRLNNKAFTLVEIILAVALLAAASVSIGGIIMSTQNTSNQMLSEQDLQQQLVEMQQTVHNETLQTNAGIKYWVKEQGKDTYSLVLNDGDTSTPGQESLYDEKVIAYYNLNREDYILEKKYYVYDVEEKTIKTSTSTLNLPINDETKREDIVMKMDDNIAETLLNITDWSLLANNVSDWSVDLQHYHKNRLISYNIELTQDGIKYPTEETVYVRNDIAVNGDLTLDKYDTLKVPKPYIDEFDFYYDGTIQGPSLKNYNERYWMLSEATVTLAKNVGTYEITFVPKDGTVWDNGTDVGSAETITYTWRILPKSIGVDWGELSWPYDGKQHSTTCVISSGIIGDDVCDLVLSNNLVGPDVGEQVVTVETTNPNYTVQKSDASKTIKIIQSIIRVNWLEKSWEYCKAVKSPKYTLISDEGIVGKVDLVFEDGNIGPNVGKKTVTYHLSNPNYKLENNTVELEIYPKTVILQWNGESWTYDNKIHSTICTVINLEPGDVCNVTLSGNSVGPDVGSKIVRAERLSNPNYKLSENGETKQISISKLVAELEWGNTTWTYNGSTRYATCIIKNAPAGSVYKLEIPGNGITNTGNKTVSVLLKEGTKNFTLPNNRTRTLIMNPKPVSLLWGKTEWDYDGREHSTTCEVNPSDIVNGDSVYPYLIRNYIGPAVGDARTVEAVEVSNSNYRISPNTEHVKTLRILAPKYPTLRWNDAWYTDGTSYPKEQITKIIFKDSGAPSSFTESWDASENNDGTIHAYRNGTQLTVVGNGSGKIYTHPNSFLAFADFDRVGSFDSGCLDTSKTEDMTAMFRWMGFYHNGELKIYLRNWDTSNVRYMSGMFLGIGKKENGMASVYGLENFNTSNVWTMSDMFKFITNLTTISAIQNWDVSNVEDMSKMFQSYGDISYPRLVLDLSQWRPRNLRTIKQMFEGAGSFDSVVPVNPNIQNVDINVSNWTTTSLENCNSAFSSIGLCALDYPPGISKIKFAIRGLDTWDVSNVTDMNGMFAFSGTIYKQSDFATFSTWDTSNVTDMAGMFASMGIEGFILDLSGWNVNKVTNHAQFGNPFDGTHGNIIQPKWKN